MDLFKKFCQGGKKGEFWQIFQMVSELAFNTLGRWGMSGEGVLDFETAKSNFKKMNFREFWKFLWSFLKFFQNMWIFGS